jgi:pimeloyl-ACP methyl ester carboxylesterase
MWPQFTPEIRATILRDGVWHRPSDYGEPYAITRALIEDGRQQQVMTEKLPFRFPVRILQGMRDADVPWAHALRFAEAIDGDDVRVHLIKDGDHRLSRPQDIALLISELSRLIEE